MFVAATFALLAVAQPEPLDPDLACIVDRIPATARAGALAEATSGTRGAAREAFRDATAACARERSWSEDFAAGAGRLAIAVVLGEEAETVLRQNGISPDLVHDWFDRQPEAIRRGEPTVEVTTALVMHLHGQGIALELLQANAPAIGAMFAALNLIERTGAGLE